MYTREFQESRPSPIDKGAPLFGTWTGAFQGVDLLDIQKPYRFPSPRWVRDLRIKEWETFIIQDERFLMEALFSNLKVYRMAQVLLYDKTSGEKLQFIKAIPFSGWQLPKGLANAAVDSHSWGFFFRIHDWLDADTIKLDLNIEASSKRPSFTAHAEFDVSAQKTGAMSVCLPFSGRRCMYAFKTLAAVRGDLVFGGEHYFLDPEKTSGIFADFKGFFPYRTRANWCNGFGPDEKGRRFGFSLAENQTREAYKNNENVLWLDDGMSLLPPVKITMPEGIGSDWIIQDMEGMVDLVFSPKEAVRNSRNLLFINSEYITLLGYYNGVLVSSGGEEIQVKNLWSTGEQLYLRI
ncbi:MAG: DUF2804 domain-containing protein [Treponema sp.]|jgi:hypothetical protein|nr:DUF2804 domain-containing protein [Treponema sp.]